MNRYGHMAYGVGKYGNADGKFGQQHGESWVNRMIVSYISLHTTLPAGVEDELRLRLQPGTYLHNTFGPGGQNKTICDFVLAFKIDGDTGLIVGSIKTGDVLRWDFDGSVYSQTNVPAHTLGAGAGIVTMSTTDGWSGYTRMIAYTSNFVGSTPNFFNAGLTSLTQLQIQANSFTEGVGRWALPSSLTLLYLHANAFSDDVSLLTIPNGLVTLFLYSNSFDVLGTFIEPTLITLRIENNGLSEAEVDRVLADYVAIAGVAGVNLDLSQNFVINIGGSNAAPSLTGFADVATLMSYDWAGGGGSVTITVSGITTDLFSPLDFTDLSWIATNVTIDDADSFTITTTGGDITSAAILTIGKNYLMRIQGSEAGLITDLSVSGAGAAYKSGLSTAWDQSFVFTADATTLKLTGTGTGQIDITLMTVYQLD